jgi:uncharacterized iron-regulated protein
MLAPPNFLSMRTYAPLLIAALLGACAVTPPACVPPGQWVSPGTLHRLTDPVPASGSRPVVLLGEQHDSAADHSWELDTVKRLAAANPSLVLGFEMFPREAQPALNDWVGGRLSEAAFLKNTDWARFWGFPPELYLPIFRFARDHHIPMIALNVSHRLVHLTAQGGFAAVPTSDREGIGVPAPPSTAYRADLAEAMAGHGGPAMTPSRLDHFIDAQLVWDRAMAEAIAAQRARFPGRQVVALMGAGHLEHRYGVPHQLEALGIPGALVLLPAYRLCAPEGGDYADAVYVE